MLNPLSTDPHAPWKQRFRVATMENGQIARDNPARGVICSNVGGIFQLHAWDAQSSELRQLTSDPHGNLLGAISPNGRWVYTVLDPDGDQYGHFARVPFEGGALEDLTPGFPQYPLAQICVSASGNMLAFAVPRAASDGTDLYVIPLDEALSHPRHLFHDPIPGLHGRKRLGLSADGEVLIFASNQRNPAVVERLLAFDVLTGALLHELSDGPRGGVSLGEFSPVSGDPRVLATLHRHEITQVLLWNPCTGELRPLEWDLPGWVTPVTWTPDASQLLLYQEYQSKSQHIFFSLLDGSNQVMQDVVGLRWSVTFGNAQTLYVHRADRRPAEVLAMDRVTGSIQEVVLSGGPVPTERPWTDVSFSSSDGTSIQAWLITPEGKGPFPTILYVHGGPRECVREGYAPEFQLWTDHGFAVCAVNYRGSVGFGRAFEEHIVGRPGYWELEDIVACRNFLVEQGIALAYGIFLTGWSYGGYLTLLALGRFPDLWAGGMAGYAIADWTAHYEEAGQGVKLPSLFGGTPEEKPEQYRISSPITYAEQIQAPLFIYQGRNDPGCPPRQVQHYAELLQALGKPVEMVWIDLGHGTLDTEQAIATQELLLRFAYRVFDEKQAGA